MDESVVKYLEVETRKPSELLRIGAKLRPQCEVSQRGEARAHAAAKLLQELYPHVDSPEE